MWMHQIERLRSIMPHCWDAETSIYPDAWIPERPSLGQCAVTALVVQDLVCLRPIRGRVVFLGGNGDGHYLSHYWNEGADLTAEQFKIPTLPQRFCYIEVKPEGGQSVRDYLLQSSDTARRYELLRQRVALALGG